MSLKDYYYLFCNPRFPNDERFVVTIQRHTLCVVPAQLLWFVIYLIWLSIYAPDDGWRHLPDVSTTAKGLFAAGIVIPVAMTFAWLASLTIRYDRSAKRPPDTWLPLEPSMIIGAALVLASLPIAIFTSDSFLLATGHTGFTVALWTVLAVTCLVDVPGAVAFASIVGPPAWDAFAERVRRLTRQLAIRRRAYRSKWRRARFPRRVAPQNS